MILDLGDVANRSLLSLPLIGVSVLVLVGVVGRWWTALIGWICGSDRGGPGGNCVRGLLWSCPLNRACGALVPFSDCAEYVWIKGEVLSAGLRRSEIGVGLFTREGCGFRDS